MPPSLREQQGAVVTVLQNRAGQRGSVLVALGPLRLRVRTFSFRPVNRAVLASLPGMAAETQFTPMMAQYRRIKSELPKDALLLCRLGDFDEMFFDDAQAGAQLLNLASWSFRTTPIIVLRPRCSAVVRSFDEAEILFRFGSFWTLSRSRLPAIKRTDAIGAGNSCETLETKLDSCPRVAAAD